MSSAATMLRTQTIRQREGRIEQPEPAFPWRLHRFNPSIPPFEPLHPDSPDYCPVPVMWHNQCRDCFGWVDDPRHS